MYDYPVAETNNCYGANFVVTCDTEMWHRRLLWQPVVLPVTAKLASWRLCSYCL